jgi:hypothetical protein
VSARAAVAAYPEHLRSLVEEYLTGLRFAREPATEGLEEAMRYSLLAGASGRFLRSPPPPRSAATPRRCSRSPPRSS